jgi:hypothetical protein
MGSGVMIHVSVFIKIGSGIQKLLLGIHRHIGSKVISLALVYSFFKIKKSRLKSKTWCE